MSNPMPKIGVSIAEMGASLANEINTKQYQKNVDEMFEAIHKAQSSKPDDYKYKKENYERFAFSSRAELEDFKQHAADRGITVASADVKLNGQYILELDKKVEVQDSVDAHVIQYARDNQSVTMDFASNHLKEAESSSADAMFAALFTSNPANRGSAYDENQYHRLSFTDKTQAEDFAAEMNKQGLSATKVIPFTTGSTTNFLVEVDKTTTLTGSTSMPASQYVSQYTSETTGQLNLFEKIKANAFEPFGNYTTVNVNDGSEGLGNGDKDATNSASHLVDGFVARNLDDLGRSVVAVTSFTEAANQFLKHNQSPNVRNETDPFKFKGENGYTTGQTAYVVGSAGEHTVISGGKVVTNPVEKAQILHDHYKQNAKIQHKADRIVKNYERMDAIGEKIHNRFSSTPYEKKFTSKQAYQNAQDIKNGVFENEKASATYAAENSGMRALASGGQMTDYVSRLNAANVAVAEAQRRIDNVGKDYFDRDLRPASSDKMAKLDTPSEYRPLSTKAEDFISKNAQKVGNAVASKTVKPVGNAINNAGRKIGNKAVNKLNKLPIATGIVAANRTVNGIVTKRLEKIDWQKSNLHKDIQLAKDEAAVAQSIMDATTRDFRAELETIANLKKDLGIDLAGKNITNANILAANEKVIRMAQAKGIQLVRNGKLDVDLLKSQAKNIGISDSTARLVASSSNGTLGQMPRKAFTGEMFRTIGGKLVNLTSDEGLGEIQHAVGTVYQVSSYARQISTSTHQFTQSFKMKIEAHKAKLAAKRAKKGTTKKPKKTPNKPKKPSALQSAKNKFNERQTKKYIKKEAQKVKKLEKYNNSLRGKLNNAMNKASQKIANSKLGKLASKVFSGVNAAKAFLIKAGLIAAGVFLLIEGGLVLIFIVISSVLSLFEKNYTDYAAYKLYEMSLKNEKKWVEIITDYDKIFDNKDGAGWGVRCRTFEQYIDECVNKDVDADGNVIDAKKVYYTGEDGRNLWQLITDGGKEVYINPFWAVDGLVTEDNENASLLTELTDFNGKEKLEISANTNLANEKVNDEDYTYVTIENGHISNIKDIIAMTDLMYQFDINGSSDSVMSDSPIEINWQHFKTSFAKFMNWQSMPWWEQIDALIQGDFSAYYEGSEDGTASWTAIKAYADNLFWHSHTHYFETDVMYYDLATQEELLKFAKTEVKEEIEAQIAAGEIPRTITIDDLLLTEREMCTMELCANPNLAEMEIQYDQEQDKIRPYIEAEDGTKHYLDEGTFEIDITYDELTFPDDACLWDGMGSDKPTYDNIRRHTSTDNIGADIIAEEEAAGIDKNPDDKTRHYCWEYTEGSRETNKSGATLSASGGLCDTPDEAIGQAISKINNSLKGYDSDTPISTDNYELSDDHNVFTADSVYYKESVSRADMAGSPNVQGVMVGFDESGMPVYKYYVIVSCYITDKVGEKYTRGCASEDGSVEGDCQKHEFGYCGGHLDIQAHGVVYSINNEHQATVNAYKKNELAPAALDWERKDMGYDKIRGRVDDFNKADKSAFITMDSSGGAVNFIQHVQGSLVASCNHYNFLVNSTGNWGTGMTAFGEAGEKADQYAAIYRNMYRDIFDIDLIIDKGWNVLPLGGEDAWKKYECWNADNITMAALKIQMDWFGLYEFDAPYEMNQKLVAEEDITVIIKSLQENGYCTSKEQEDAATIALGFVGRGHYSQYHDDHDFLTSLCEAEVWKHNHTSDDGDIKDRANAAGGGSGELLDANGFDGCCTAGTSETFVKFVLTTTGVKSATEDISGWRTYNGMGTLKTGDVLRHKASERVGDIEIPDELMDALADGSVADGDDIVDYVNSMLTDHYIIYIGTTGSCELNDGTDLSNKALFVDLSFSDFTAWKNGKGDPDADSEANSANIGVIRLRYDDTTTDSYTYVTSATEYPWWVTNPDGNVEVSTLYRTTDPTPPADETEPEGE